MTPTVLTDDRVNVVPVIDRTGVLAVTNTEGVIGVRIDHAERSNDLVIWRR